MIVDPLMVPTKMARYNEVVSKDMQTVLWVRHLLGCTVRANPLQAYLGRLVCSVSRSEQGAGFILAHIEEAVS